MFKKPQDSDGWSVASPPRIGEKQPIRSKNVSVIGPTLVFKGELSADEDLMIEGTIEGTIAHHKKNLMIGKQGREPDGLRRRVGPAIRNDLSPMTSNPCDSGESVAEWG